MQYRIEQNVWKQEGAVCKEGAGGLGKWVLDTGVWEGRGTYSSKGFRASRSDLNNLLQRLRGAKRSR